MKSLLIAFSMYSRLPMPRVEWEPKALSWALCWFPLVGVAAGLALGGWMWLARVLGVGRLFFAAFAVLIPIGLSGGIHLDGFCDTCDALASHQSRARKLEILKDPHAGAFGVFGCGLYLLVFFAGWSEVEVTPRAVWALALGPVLSRSLSGLFALTLPNARGTGLLAAFTEAVDVARARAVLIFWVTACAAALVLLGGVPGGAALLGALLACFYYVRTARRQFGGVTGDLAGFFLQLCELGMVLAVVAGQKIEVLL